MVRYSFYMLAIAVFGAHLTALDANAQDFCEQASGNNFWAGAYFPGPLNQDPVQTIGFGMLLDWDRTPWALGNTYFGPRCGLSFSVQGADDDIRFNMSGPPRETRVGNWILGYFATPGLKVRHPVNDCLNVYAQTSAVLGVYLSGTDVQPVDRRRVQVPAASFESTGPVTGIEAGGGLEWLGHYGYVYRFGFDIRTIETDLFTGIERTETSLNIGFAILAD